MKNNNFGYLVREGIRGIFLHGFMSFAAVCVTVACLIIVGSFSLILYNVNNMVVQLEKENEVLVYIDETYSEAQAKSVGSKINLVDNVLKAQFVSRQQALDNFIAEQGDASTFSGLESDTFRDRFIVTLEDNSKMRQTITAITAIEGVADYTAHYELAEGFTTLEHVVRIVSLAIIAVLLVVSLFIISNTVKLAMYDRKAEIGIMKMVGATDNFIRFPFVVEGFILGVIGAAIAFGIVWLLYDLLAMKVSQVDSFQLFNFVPFGSVLWIMVVMYALAGLFVGVFGSLMSIRKFLDV